MFESVAGVNIGVIVPDEAPHSTTDTFEIEKTPVLTEAVSTKPAVETAVITSTKVPIAARAVPATPPNVNATFDEVHAEIVYWTR